MIEQAPQATTEKPPQVAEKPLGGESLHTARILGLPWFSFLCFALYVAIVLFTIPFHEPWADESQAWLLARDSSFGDLLFHHLHYERSPGLWQTLLWLLIHIGHAPFWFLNWFSAMIAATGIYVLLRLSPLPKPVTFILPFTFFLQYQYAVVARSYVLFPLFCFLCAHYFRKGESGALGFSIAAGLMANISPHGTMIAGLLCVVYVSDLIRRRDRQTTTINDLFRRVAIPALVALALCTFALIVSKPAADADLAGSFPLKVYEMYPKFIFQYGLTKMFDASTFPFSTSKILGSIMLLATCLWFRSLKYRRLLIPFFSLCFFFGFVYWRGWHVGVLPILLVSMTWMVWPEKGHAWKGWNLLFFGMLTICLVEQIAWSAVSIYNDVRSPYTGAKQAADFIRSLPPGTRIYGYGYGIIGTLPYFEHNVFINQPEYSYWHWSLENRGKNGQIDVSGVARQQPDYILLASSSDEWIWHPPTTILSNYDLAHVSRGLMFMRFSYAEPSCYYFYRLRAKNVPGH